jgi:hypothetical protein
VPGTGRMRGLAVDPVTIGAVLAAIAGGVAEGLGGQLWAGVCALVRRPLGRRSEPQPAAVTDGSAQLAALEQVPGDLAAGGRAG